jgi:hypothetical protein
VIVSTTTVAKPRDSFPPSADTWVAAFIEGWRAPSDPDAFVAHFRPILAPDVHLVQPQLPDVTGVRAFEDEFVRPLFTLMPDIRGEVERWAAQGDVLYIELTLHGTLGGRPISWRACDRVSLRDGLAIERESYFDPTPLLAAVATRPRAWLPFVRLQARRITNHLSTRRKP